MTNSNKLGVVSLAALVVSAMIGGGVYNLPQNMAQYSSTGAIIIAWIITGIGMWFIASTFSTLSAVKPDMTTGIYGYGQLGFGRFTGFFVAWGYWICNVCANIGYAVLLMDSLNYFFPPYFEGGNNLLSVIGGSIIIWVIYFIVMAGVKQTAIINNIGVIGKLIPIGIFIAVLAFFFDPKVFSTDFWGKTVIPSLDDKGLGGIFDQIKSTMLVTLWVFIGIEGAVVISGKARSQKDVGKATVIGFVLCLVAYVLLSLLPLGYFSQGQLSTMAAPSTGGVLEGVVGNWGGILMNVGVMISILSSWLVWTLMLASLPYQAAKDGTFPKAFARENKNESPSFSLLVSSILMQIFMIIVYFADNAWNLMLSITGVMILPCYFVCTLYLWKISTSEQSFKNNSNRNIHVALLTGILGSAYAVWLIYAAGIGYMLVAAIIYALGIPVYWWSRKEGGTLAEINHGEKVFMLLIVLAGIAGVFYTFINYKTLMAG